MKTESDQLHMIRRVLALLALITILAVDHVAFADTMLGFRSGAGFRGHQSYLADRRRFLGSIFLAPRYRSAPGLDVGILFDWRAGAGSFDLDNLGTNIGPWTSFETTMDIVPSMFLSTPVATPLRIGAGFGISAGFEHFEIGSGESALRLTDNLAGWALQPSVAILPKALELSLSAKWRMMYGGTTQSSSFGRFDKDLQRQSLTFRPQIVWVGRRWQAGAGVEIERVRRRLRDDFRDGWAPWPEWPKDWEYAPYLTFAFPFLR